jgi:hypothetical protein
MLLSSPVLTLCPSRRERQHLNKQLFNNNTVTSGRLGSNNRNQLTRKCGISSACAPLKIIIIKLELNK